MTTQPTIPTTTPTAFYFQSKPVRQTGTTVTIGHAEDLGLKANASGAWFTICVDHSKTVRYTTLRLAATAAPKPITWCPKCAKKSAAQS